jgi:hypothetical protein
VRDVKVINVINITGYEVCPTDITINLWCPKKPRFPGKQGCGKLFKSFGIVKDDETLEQVKDTIVILKTQQVTCSECSYVFTPSEVYV